MNEPQVGRGRLFFYFLFAILAILVIYILHPYLTIIAVALITVVLLKPLYDWFYRRKRIQGRVRIATTLTLITFFLLILIPILILGFLLFSQTNDLLQELKSAEIEFSLQHILAAMEDFLKQLPGLRNIELDGEVLAQSLISLASAALNWLASLATGLGTSLATLFISAIVFLIVVGTLLPIVDDVENRIQELSPLQENITQIYLLKSEKMIVSVIKGVFLLAIIQGAIMGIFYWLAGVPFNIFFTLLSMAFAVLPVVGISFIVLPMALIFLLTGNVTSAIIVLVGFYVFVNPTDLTLRPRMVSKEAYLNFTLMMLALFGGLAVGGLLGMIYGPVIMVLFITTIDIYSQYFSRMSGQSLTTGADSEATREELPVGEPAHEMPAHEMPAHEMPATDEPTLSPDSS